ncbi:hypothetical protein QEZ54_24690 [Catellatospora sp. KI3]|uniref:hypothetical protein n=1 Tax=Catellatospora sp. KI3 TaxID=3041620 RepID=UPI0024829025|nr:hypothetical protein [Catellatospora sp. KI3]MDI1464181.1 hypothetical protein [Catellatospora sp. KI3]
MSLYGQGTRSGWGALVAAAGVSASAGAAQLGIGYGLGVFSWLPALPDAGQAAWLASLAWTVWISAFSVVLGAVVADRLSAQSVQSSTVVRVLWRIALAISASLGGLIVVALTAIPARGAHRADTFAPHLLVGGYAVAGVLLGLLIAIAALSARAIAANLFATGGWLWLLTVTAAVDGLAAGREPGVSQLGVWPVTADGPWFRSLYLPGAAIAAASTLLIGLLAAWPAVRRRDAQAGIVLSGAAGPALVAAAYLLAAPTLTGVAPEQLSAHLIAPYSVVTGLVGAVLAIVIGWPRRPKPAVPAQGRAKPRPAGTPTTPPPTPPVAIAAAPAPASTASTASDKGSTSDTGSTSATSGTAAAAVGTDPAEQTTAIPAPTAPGDPTATGPATPTRRKPKK